MNKPTLYAHNAFFFSLSGAGKRRFSIVLDDSDPRVYLSNEDKLAKSESSPFFDSLRRELGNPYVVDVNTLNDDRVLSIDLTIINSVFKEEAKSLVIELLPHHANLLVLDNDKKILALYRPSDLMSERPLQKGLLYTPPIKNGFAKTEDAFDENEYEASCLTKEIGLALVRKKDLFGDVYDSLKRREKTLNRKIGAIGDDLKKANEHLSDNLIGDYIFTNYSSLADKAPTLDMDGRSVGLDPRKNKSQNAQAFYKRAKKSKSALEEGKKNLQKAEDELENIKLSIAFFLEGDEEGLERLAGSINTKAKKERPKEKSNPFGLTTASLPYYVVYDGTKILFGRNATQNDVLSFLLDTSKDHLWLHVNGSSGSHVMIKKDEATPKEEEMAAEIALLASNLAEGEVMVTERRNVSRGRKPGEAIVKKFAMIEVKQVSDEAKELILTAQKYFF